MHSHQVTDHSCCCLYHRRVWYYFLHTVLQRRVRAMLRVRQRYKSGSQPSLPCGCTTNKIAINFHIHIPSNDFVQNIKTQMNLSEKKHFLFVLLLSQSFLKMKYNFF